MQQTMKFDNPTAPRTQPGSRGATKWMSAAEVLPGDWLAFSDLSRRFQVWDIERHKSVGHLSFLDAQGNLCYSCRETNRVRIELDAENPERITARTIQSMMRKSGKTIRSIASQHSISIQRVRKVRALGAAGFLASEWIFLATGAWPVRSACQPSSIGGQCAA